VAPEAFHSKEKLTMTEPIKTPTDAPYGDDCQGVRGDTRAPKFGEWMRGVYASASNPHRDGMFVRTERRAGRFNPGTWHELTDGNGNFWSYPASCTVFLAPPTQPAEPPRVPQPMPDLTQLTERGATAWAGVDPQALREGREPLTEAQKEARNPYRHSRGAASIWLAGFNAAELWHRISKHKEGGHDDT
jgi:hypothetical protein